MARNPLISAARLQLIEKRQLQPKWGPLYEPSMRATRDEAPTISRPSTLYSAKIGRELHLMSIPERQVGVLAMYHPRVFDIHEQHMLHPFAGPHPLAGRDDTRGFDLPSFRGTVDVADRLGKVSMHPTVWITGPSASGYEGQQERAAFPYLGDFLIFQTDSKGPYCVNWSVKKSPGDFSNLSAAALLNPAAAKQKMGNAELRHRLEEIYFDDAGIKTHRIAASEIDTQVSANLTALIGRASAPSLITADTAQHILQRFQNALGTATALSLLASMMHDFGCTRADCLTVFYRSIWERHLRVDLYRPIVVDKVMRPERSDVLLDYATWFAR